MAPQYGDEYPSGKHTEHDMSDSSTTRPISIPHPIAGDRRSRIGDMDPGKDKRQSMRVNGITISTELFEKMFLLPQKEAKRGVFENLGNPTPIGLMGTMLALTPLACDLMGWRGAGGNGYASIGAYYWFGGALLLIGGMLNYFAGDTFSFIVFLAYGAFWLTFAYTLEPSYLAFAAYSPDASNPTLGLKDPSFNASFGFFLVFMALLNLVFLICSLKTDIAHVIVFSSLLLAFGLLTGQHWNLALIPPPNALADELQFAAGASLFVTSMACWWLFIAEMLDMIDFPYRLPVGDLSGFMRGMRERELGHITHMV